MLQQAYATASLCDSKPSYVSIRQHTSAYVSAGAVGGGMRQQAYATASPHTSADVSTCHQTSAYAAANLATAKPSGKQQRSNEREIHATASPQAVVALTLA